MTNTPPQIIELRQYTLHPGARETLITLFDSTFIEPQEAAGMHVIGQFRDLDAPDRFVWMRGFPDMEARRQSLAAFYGGPVWKAHREAANATMIDSDNVLLLRPLRADSGPGPAGPRPPPPSDEAPVDGTLVASIVYLTAPVDADFVKLTGTHLRASLAGVGAPLLAELVSADAENTFPALPVREGEHVYVWLSTGAALEVATLWPAAAEARFALAPEILRLSPTARSLLRP